MSFGLTQYDVEDLIRYSKNCCKLLGICADVFMPYFNPCIDILQSLQHAVSQGEIEALYQRFRSLDRGHKVGKRFCEICCKAYCACYKLTKVQGYISAEEFMNIPELSINPLAHRLERVFESVNFKVMEVAVAPSICLLVCKPVVVHLQEFVYLLSAFSSRAALDDKIHLIFTVYDSDGDGLVSADDMELMLRQLAGSTLRSASGNILPWLHVNISTAIGLAEQKRKHCCCNGQP